MVKILVVEDTDSLRKDILEMLTFEKFEVVGAEDGLAGVQQAREHTPDLIICDILMPGLDGYGVLTELQKDSLMATIPFIFLTAKADKSDMRRGMEMGAYDYLTKPFTAPELLAAVRTQLQKRETLRKASDVKIGNLVDNIIVALPHELRTPLTSILGFSDIIASDCEYREKEQIAEMANYISNAGNRLFRLTENYLAYAQLKVMATNPQSTTVIQDYNTSYLRDIIENEALRKAQEAHRETDLALDIEDGVTVHILGDHLKKIVEELVDNACKFSPLGTPIRLTASVRGNQYVLSIADQGRGMKPAQIASIGAYMQFERKDYEQQGVGLGLAIVKHLAELYGGQMNIHSVPAQGTEVSVVLNLT